jgi:hypothetical protein
MKTFKQFQEGLLKKAILTVGGAVLAKKGLDKAKEKFDNFLDNQRDKGMGGNTRPGADQIYYGDKKKK